MNIRESKSAVPVCACHEGEGCTFSAMGYPWCRSCAEHHRPPECPINEAGESLAPCGCTWAETDAPGYYDKPCRHRVEEAEANPRPAQLNVHLDS